MDRRFLALLLSATTVQTVAGAEAWPQFRGPDGLGNVPLTKPVPWSDTQERLGPDDVVCHQWLGGLLKHYERKAA